MRARVHVTVLVASLALLAGMPVEFAGAQDPSFPPPTDLWAAQTSPTEIRLQWQRVPRAVLYRLYAIDGSSARSIGTIQRSGESFVQRIREYDVPLVYAIEAVADNGRISERVRFNAVTPVQPSSGGVAAPVSVAAEAASSGVISVRWTAVPGATAYMIGRAVSPGGYRLVCSLCPTTTTYVDSVTTAGARHTYTVVAFTPSGPSRPGRSSPVVPTVSTIVATPPPSPNAPPAESAPKGTIRVRPFPGSCLSLGSEGNFIVRLADGTVRTYERVKWLRRGPSFPGEPKLEAVPGVSDAVGVATSGEYWLALRSDGTILSWGNAGALGRLGREVRMIHRPGDPALPAAPETPAPVREITNAVAISAGEEHGVALLADSTIRTWGTGAHGIPGDGSPVSTTRFAPATVLGIESAVAVAARGSATFALLADGTVRSWGWNRLTASTLGALGNGTNAESSAVPVPVAGIRNAVAVVPGAILLADGTVRAWGFGYGPHPGRGLPASNTPSPIEGVRDAVAVTPFMVLLRDGTVREFGAREWPWETPKLSNVVAIASDAVNRFALLSDGKLMAWGLKRFYRDGLVLRAELGAATARECAARGLGHR